MRVVPRCHGDARTETFFFPFKRNQVHSKLHQLLEQQYGVEIVPERDDPLLGHVNRKGLGAVGQPKPLHHHGKAPDVVGVQMGKKMASTKSAGMPRFTNEWLQGSPQSKKKSHPVDRKQKRRMRPPWRNHPVACSQHQNRIAQLRHAILIYPKRSHYGKQQMSGRPGENDDFSWFWRTHPVGTQHVPLFCNSFCTLHSRVQHE